jgi:hypothetical protein
MAAMQATVVLQESWTTKVVGHLEEHEVKKTRVSKRVLGDGMPHLLTDERFVAEVEKHEREVERRLQQQQQGAEKRKMHSGKLKEWVRLDKERVARNNERRKAHKQAVKAWEAERAVAKAEGRRLDSRNKPKLLGIEPPGDKPPKEEEWAQ